MVLVADNGKGIPARGGLAELEIRKPENLFSIEHLLSLQIFKNQ